MLFITGFGRSGTSVLSRFLQMCGYNFRGEWVNATDAGAEDAEVRNINAQIQAYFRGEQKLPLTEIRNKMRAFTFDGAKCPHFGTYEGKLLRYWADARRDFGVIYTIRQPEACLESRRRVAKKLGQPSWWGPRGEDISLFYKDFYGCIATMEELDIPYEILYYPWFLDRFDRILFVFHRMGFDISYEKGFNIWNKLMNKDMVHIKDKWK